MDFNLSKKMKNIICYIIILLISTSCIQENLFEATADQYIQDDSVSWYFNIDTSELFIQLDFTGFESGDINHVYVKSSSLDLDDFYEIYDDGNNGDIIPNNGIYSLVFSDIDDTNYTLNVRVDRGLSNLIQDFSYDINFNSPLIIDDSFYPVLPTEHILDQSELTYLNIVIAVDDLDGYNDIDYVKFFIKKVNFFNGSLVDGVCDYQFIENDEYQWDPSWIMNYIDSNASGHLVYNARIPMNPIQSSASCGGFGYVQFKFEVKDSKGFINVLEQEDTVQICPGVCE
tara:strand:- start:628 stop:1485 length:858 start_codon:yes stop_codon:yes gene_type:complete